MVKSAKIEKTTHKIQMRHFSIILKRQLCRLQQKSCDSFQFPILFHQDKNQIGRKAFATKQFSSRNCPNDRVIILDDLNFCTFFSFPQSFQHHAGWFNSQSATKNKLKCTVFCVESQHPSSFLRTIIIIFFFFIGLNFSLHPSIEFSKLLCSPFLSYVSLLPSQWF